MDKDVPFWSIMECDECGYTASEDEFPVSQDDGVTLCPKCGSGEVFYATEEV